MSEEEKIESVPQGTLEAPAAPDVMASVVHSDDEPVVSAKELLAVGAHYGHQARRWNPTMAPYIYTKKNNAHIIDLNKTAAMIQSAYLKLKGIVEKGGKVLFVGTKPIAKDVIVNEATRAGAFYVNNRWLGGTLTNFKTISKRVKLLKTLKDEADEGRFETLSKKEGIAKAKQLERLDNLLGGIKEMRKIPDAIVIVDTNYEHNAVHEAKLLHIPSFGLIDTNCDPSCVTDPIPMNVDGPDAVVLVVGILADAVVAGKGGTVAYAYGAGSSDTSTMKEIMPSQFSQDELRVIRAKIREDIFEAKRKNKKRRKVSKKPVRRPAGNRPARPANGQQNAASAPASTEASQAPAAGETPAAPASQEAAK